MTLLTAAIAATLADCIAFVLLVLPGSAGELNPIVARMDPRMALALRGLLLVFITCIYIAAEHERAKPYDKRARLSRAALRVVVTLMLLIATAIGAVGAWSTVTAA